VSGAVNFGKIIRTLANDVDPVARFEHVRLSRNSFSVCTTQSAPKQAFAPFLPPARTHIFPAALDYYLNAFGEVKASSTWRYSTSPDQAVMEPTGSDRALSRSHSPRLSRVVRGPDKEAIATAFIELAEKATELEQGMAAHESPRTTKLYDRTKERLSQDEVEMIRLRRRRKVELTENLSSNPFPTVHFNRIQ
jgi:hypothetical protein